MMRQNKRVPNIKSGKSLIRSSILKLGFMLIFILLINTTYLYSQLSYRESSGLTTVPEKINLQSTELNKYVLQRNLSLKDVTLHNSIQYPNVEVKHFEGNEYSGRNPVDNTLAISNNGILLSAINSTLTIYDTNTDSLILSIALNTFITEFGMKGEIYDPRLLYDMDEDKFILVFLTGKNSSTSNIVIANTTTY